MKKHSIISVFFLLISVVSLLSCKAEKSNLSMDFNGVFTLCVGNSSNEVHIAYTPFENLNIEYENGLVISVDPNNIEYRFGDIVIEHNSSMLFCQKLFYTLNTIYDNSTSQNFEILKQNNESVLKYNKGVSSMLIKTTDDNIISKIEYCDETTYFSISR